MIAICKKYYPYAEEMDVVYQDFLTGKTYKILDKVMFKDEFWYRVEGEDGATELFSQDEFNDFFITIAQIRKKKLLKINKNE